MSPSCCLSLCCHKHPQRALENGHTHTHNCKLHFCCCEPDGGGVLVSEPVHPTRDLFPCNSPACPPDPRRRPSPSCAAAQVIAHHQTQQCQPTVAAPGHRNAGLGACTWVSYKAPSGTSILITVLVIWGRKTARMLPSMNQGGSFRSEGATLVSD